MNPRTVLMQSEHVDAAAEVLAVAMDDDAGYRYLFPDPVRRRAGLTRFFRGNLGVHLPFRCTHVAIDARNTVVGTVTLRPPGGVHISGWKMLRHGVGPLVLAHGLGALRRLLWLRDTYEAFDAELADHQPHWYVHMMAVAPEVQGRGVGSMLLDTVLANVGSKPVVLTTHSMRNVVFYRRAGFAESWERRLEPEDGAPYSVWGMARTACVLPSPTRTTA